jgi:hypothetical protein
MNYELLKAAIQKKVQEEIVKQSAKFINEFRFHDSDDPTDVIAEFDLNYSKSTYAVIRAVLEGVRDGINTAGDRAFDKCISNAVANGDLSEERADIVSNEYKSYENMNIEGIVDNYFNPEIPRIE